MEINERLCPASEYSIKCPYTMSPVGVCIHNTANDASAENEVSYMLGNDSNTGFHYAVDDKEIIQAIPINRNAWHAGDGNGDGNRKYISIEICYSKSGGARFEAAMKNAAELTAKLLAEHGWDLSHVKKHQDFSGKNCPQRILESYGWDYFLGLVGTALGDTDEKTPVLTSGSTGEAVRRLQDRLNAWGYALNPDGIFGPDTLAAVKKFQARAGLTADGIVGPMTWEKLLGEVQSTMAKFNDTSGHRAEKLIDELADMGIVQGDKDGNFHPDDPATRAETAQMVRNAVKYITGK